VSLQVTVTAVIGGSVLLPCSSTEEDHKLRDINVFWRHNGSKIVCDISIRTELKLFHRSMREETSPSNSTNLFMPMEENTPASSHTHLNNLLHSWSLWVCANSRLGHEVFSLIKLVWFKI